MSSPPRRLQTARFIVRPVLQHESQVLRDTLVASRELLDRWVSVVDRVPTPEAAEAEVARTLAQYEAGENPCQHRHRHRGAGSAGRLGLHRLELATPGVAL